MQYKYELQESKMNGIEKDTRNTSNYVTKIEDKMIESVSHVTKMQGNVEVRINDMQSHFRQDIIDSDAKLN